MTAILSPADLERVTGRKQKSRQIAYLRKRRIRHFVSDTGHPVVRWEWLDGGGSLPQEPRLQLLPGGA